MDREACTLCMACASVCPAGAINAGGELPRLDFIELNCVQCGLCESACPEDAIRREMAEETATEVTVGPLVAIVENFFTHDRLDRVLDDTGASTYHEMGMYFQGGAFQMDTFLEAAKARLEIERTRFQGMWKPVEVDVRVGDPAMAIDDYAREKQVDLIVMTTHQPGMLERIFVGSVAEGTLRDAPCPVMVVPVRPAATTAEQPSPATT